MSGPSGRAAPVLLAASLALAHAPGAMAQGTGFTYRHDASRYNQFLAMEVGGGVLTPSWYYQAFHRGYRLDALAMPKAEQRALAEACCARQVPSSVTVDSALCRRALVEAANVADRQVDLAWALERPKVQGALDAFSLNVDRIPGLGGGTGDQAAWRERLDMFECALEAVREAYMPNSERKARFLEIHDDVTEANARLVAHMVHLLQRRRARELLAWRAGAARRDVRAARASEAYTRWRVAAWGASAGPYAARDSRECRTKD